MDKNSRGFLVIIDDDPEIRSMLQDHFVQEGFFVKAFEDGKLAMEFLCGSSPEAQLVDLVITDIRMPEIDGITVLRNYKAHHPMTPVIMITAHASVESAIEGLRKGAFDYITKPFKLNEITFTAERAVTFGRLQRQNLALSKEVKKSWSLSEVIGKSSAMRSIFDLIERIAPANSNVLITGESGTGKEVVAKAIHNRSPRSGKPFVAINCTAIPEQLLESELFGHAKGSFTGAIATKKGLFEEAEGGTLFLDEIGDMDMNLQAKLLRVLQDRKIRSVGDTQYKEINVRIIAATHKDLKKAIANGTFREDLYYRLAVIPIVVPPLRHRPEDIPHLAHHFLMKYSILNGGRVNSFSEEAMHKLITMAWPGNVRELENLIERVVVLTPHPIIQAEDIPSPEMQNIENFFGQAVQDYPTLEDLEKRYIRVILEKTGGKKEKASQILGINRRTLYRKERDYGFVETSHLQDLLDDQSEAMELKN